MSPAPKRKPQHKAKYRSLQTLLRKWREDADLTQRDLAAVLERPHTFVHKAEVGERRLDPCEWAEWATACGISPTTACQTLFGR